jgi:hypothetical protein
MGLLLHSDSIQTTEAISKIEWVDVYLTTIFKPLGLSVRFGE